MTNITAEDGLPFKHFVGELGCLKQFQKIISNPRFSGNMQIDDEILKILQNVSQEPLVLKEKDKVLSAYLCNMIFQKHCNNKIDDSNKDLFAQLYETLDEVIQSLQRECDDQLQSEIYPMVVI